MKTLAVLGFMLIAFAPYTQTTAGENGCPDVQRQLTAAKRELAKWNKWRDDNWLDLPNNPSGGMTRAEYNLKFQLESTRADLAKCTDQQGHPKGEGTLQIGTVAVRLGMPKDDLILALGDQYAVAPMRNPDSTPPPSRSYAVSSKTESDRPVMARKLMAQLFFDTKGTLVAAEKVWASGTNDGDIADAIVALFGSLELDGRTGCTIGVERFGPKLRDALVLCNGKTIRIASSPTMGQEVIEEIGTPLAAFI